MPTLVELDAQFASAGISRYDGVRATGKVVVKSLA